MRTLAVVPIKELSSAKQRLAGTLATGARQSLAQAMFSDVLASLRRSQRVEAIAVVTADVVANAVAHGERVTILPDDRQDGHSQAAMIGLRYAQGAGYDRVVLIPGDTPLLDATELDAMLDRCEADPVAVAVIADRHGTGTNALVLTPPGVFEPSFGPGSFNRHLNHARGAGLTHRAEDMPSLAHDVDTPEDLAAMSEALESARTIAPRTRGALRQLERSGVLVS
jgi:2-phospho-L-lactate/phosphoenolpyruvate guanylyltransferase